MSGTDELRRAIAELTTEMKQGRADGETYRIILQELRDAAKQQSGALAVIASKALENKKKLPIRMKPSLVLLNSLKRSGKTMRP